MQPKRGYLLSRIPNTAEGRVLVKAMHKYLNTEQFELVLRYNGPRKTAALADGKGPRAYRSFVPARHATHLRVYVMQRKEGSICEPGEIEEGV